MGSFFSTEIIFICALQTFDRKFAVPAGGRAEFSLAHPSPPPLTSIKLRRCKGNLTTPVVLNHVLNIASTEALTLCRRTPHRFLHRFLGVRLPFGVTPSICLQRTIICFLDIGLELRLLLIF